MFRPTLLTAIVLSTGITFLKFRDFPSNFRPIQEGDLWPFSLVSTYSF